METELSIGDVCATTGLSARTVRYYEEVGLLPGVRRRAAGRRVYCQDELQRLRFIQRLKALGLTLAEIKGLDTVYAIAGSTQAMLERLDDVLGQRLDELDERIRDLSVLRDDMSKYHDHVRARIESFGGRAAATSPLATPAASSTATPRTTTATSAEQDATS